MSLINLALVVESRRVPPWEIHEVAAALQRQISRDFAPIWEVDASIDGFSSLRNVPPGYWVILVRDDLPMQGVVGIHLDEKGQPYALVQHSSSWSLAASHEVLEMLADPFGSRLVPGGSPKPGQGLVEMLVEVCDPVGSPDLAYTVNGVLVSDFITPNYHDPTAVHGVRYCFSGAIRRPRDIAPGGYLSWRDPTTEEWWTWSWIGTPQPEFSRLGLIPTGAGPLREAIDSRTDLSFLTAGLPPGHPQLRVAEERHASSLAASEAHASRLDAIVAELIAGATVGPPGLPAWAGPDGVVPGPTQVTSLPPENPPWTDDLTQNR